MPKKYTGPERRDPNRDTRRVRESREDYELGRCHSNCMVGDSMRRTRHNLNDLAISPQTVSNEGRGLGAQHILSIKTQSLSTERRVLGAGRRKTDFARALKTGEPVVLDISKSPMSAFKGKGLLKKAAKKAGPLGLAISAGNLAKELKVN